MQYYGTRSTTGILGLRYTESSMGLKSGMKRNSMAVDRGCNGLYVYTKDPIDECVDRIDEG